MADTRVRVLVLGAGGQLGRDVLHAAREHPTLDVAGLTRTDLDLSETELIGARLHDMAFDVLLNCAACNRTADAERDPREAMLVNAQAVGHIARACRVRAARLLHVSSDYVFDGVSARPYVETDPVRPLNVYGASKALGETLAQMHHDDTIIVRTASLFGRAGSRSKGGTSFVDTVLARAARGVAFDVVADLTMSPTATADLAGVLLRLVAGRAPAGVYHAVNSGMATWFELACAALEAAGYATSLIRPVASDADAGLLRPRFSALDNTKVETMLDAPIRTWQEALTAYVKTAGPSAAPVAPHERGGQ